MKHHLSPYMDIQRIEFMVTHRCTGRCKHCSVEEAVAPNEGIGRLPSDRIIEMIETLSELYGITSVMTFGGEPLLYPDVVCTIHHMARKCGIEERQLITNGYFSHSSEIAKTTAVRLADAGVNHLLISVDAFHQETIPVDAVYNFARDARNLGIPTIRLHPAWVVDEKSDNCYNNRTREILAQFSDLGIPISSGNNIFMAGNAIKYLSDYYPKPKLNLSERCGSMPYTEPLDKITSLFVDPKGNVEVCGFVIGNIIHEDIVEIVSRYNPHQNECMRAIMTGGAAALLEYAEKSGVRVDVSQCYSVCNVCRSITRRMYQ